MAKPTIYFTLVAARWNDSFQVMAVTSARRGQLYGRYVDNDYVTHRRAEECIGRFDSVEAARVKIEVVAAIKKPLQLQQAALKERLEKLRNEERQAVYRALRENLPKDCGA